MQEEISFRNGAVHFSGTLITPDEPGPYPLIVVAHTSHGGTRKFSAYQHLATALPSSGVAVALFDRRGSGRSTGNFETATFFDLAADIQAAIDSLKSREDIDTSRIGVWGMSQGGWVAPLAASRSSDVSFLIAVSAAGVSPACQMMFSAKYELVDRGFADEEINQMLALLELVDGYYRGNVTRARAQKKVAALRDEAWFPFAYIPDPLPQDPTATKWYREMSFDPIPVMEKLNVPVLLIYGEQDPWIPTSKSIANWQKYGPDDLMICRIPSANHFMLTISQSGIRGDTGSPAEEYIATLVDWVRRQLDL